jgi:hypothetical protein
MLFRIRFKIYFFWGHTATYFFSKNLRRKRNNMEQENTFYFYFEQNMSALGLPAPKSLFGTLSTTTATIGSMATYVKTWGTSATLIEWVATAKGGAIAAGGGVVGMATVLSEGFLIIGGLTQ